VGIYTADLRATDPKLQTNSIAQCPLSTASYFTISGTVKNGAGTPLGGASVNMKRNGVTVKTVATASNGTFSYTLAKPGSYTLTTTKSGYAFPIMGPYTVGPNLTVVITATSGLTAPIMGAVRDTSGKALPLATIKVSKGLTAVATVRTGTDGSFAVSKIEPGTYNLAVKKKGYKFPALNPVDITAGGVQVDVQAIK